MRWRKEPRHKLVPVKDVRGATGLDPDEVLLLGDTQRLVRIDGTGTREELIRIPIELLNVEEAAEPAEQEGS
jgi:hypothetical protein